MHLPSKELSNLVETFPCLEESAWALVSRSVLGDQQPSWFTSILPEEPGEPLLAANPVPQALLSHHPLPDAELVYLASPTTRVSGFSHWSELPWNHPNTSAEDPSSAGSSGWAEATPKPNEARIGNGVRYKPTVTWGYSWPEWKKNPTTLN